MLVFDIETGARPESELRAIVPPFDPASVKGIVAGEFDPNTVKLGNLKDQAKINEKLDQAKLEFETAKANSGRMIADAEAAYWSNVIGKAALSPVTGQVLAIGLYNPESDKLGLLTVDSPADEPGALRDFWGKYRACRSANRPKIGFNIHHFDLPFLVRRSWLLGVDVPDTLFTNGRYFDPLFVDLLARWQCGGGWNEAIKLTELATFFGVGAKPDGVTGADFGRLWSEDRPAAIEYLTNDLRLTASCAARMGIV